jgi:glycosyltransferase involved in cell wall biosynthesis
VSRELNILMISHHRRYRITTRQHPIAKNLVDRGHQVTMMVTANTRRVGIEESEWDGFKVVEVPDLLWGRLRSGWDPWSIFWRTRYLSQDDSEYDFVHCFETRPATIYPALYLCKQMQIPFFTDWIDWIGRGGLVTVNRPVWYRYLFGGIETYYEEAFRARAAGLTVISNALAQRAVNLGVPQERIFHMPGGSFPDLFQMRSTIECRKRVGLDGYGPIIGFSSSDTHLDLEIVFAALAIVAQDYPQIKLLITGRAKDSIIKLAQNYQVEDRLILTGFLPFEELPWHLGCADVFVLPFPDTVYNRGRWPNKICDYMSLGRPTVSNATGDIKQLFEQHQIGFLARWDPVDFANQLMWLLDHPELACQFGNNARRLAVEKFDYSILVEKLEGFYYQILSSGHRSPQEVQDEGQWMPIR